jgi:hypothetical protein
MADRTVTLPDDMAISYLDADTPDGDVVLDVREVIRAMSTEAFRQGGRGAAHDLRLEALPWEMPPATRG